jgi:hypothetical protein
LSFSRIITLGLILAGLVEDVKGNFGTLLPAMYAFADAPEEEK